MRAMLRTVRSRRGGRLVAGALAECLVPGSHPGALARVLARGAGEELLAAARWHRVGGLVSARLCDDGAVPPALAARAWAMAEHDGRARRKVDEELHLVADALAGSGMPWLVVKGPVIAHLCYPDPSLRSYRDLDVVVPRSAFAEALDALSSAGYELIDRNWDLMAREAIGQVHLVRPGGVGLDLHWHLVSNRRLRRSFAVDMDEVFAAARPLVIGSVECHTLAWEHQLVHLCLHAALEGADRLVWLRDVAGAVAVAPTEGWERLVEVAERWRAHLATGTVLDRARRHLGADVPGWVIDALARPRAWRAVIGAVNATWPPFRAGEMGSAASLLARATRASARATLAEMVIGTGRRAWRMVTTGQRRRLDTRNDPESPRSLLHDAGGPEGRAAYLAMVAAGDA